MNYAVYRFYSAVGELLYVGQSSDMGTRLTGHQSRTDWFPHVATVTVHHFASRDGALEAERLAIIHEEPTHNIIHNRHRSDERMGRKSGLEIDTGYAAHSLRRTRKSMQWLSDETGVSRSHIGKIMDGSGRASLVVAMAMATALQVDECRLFPMIDEAVA